jgi:sphingolipid 8-(E)-desaturase
MSQQTKGFDDYDEGAELNKDQDDGSSANGSRSPSPVFDASDAVDEVRHRRGKQPVPRPASSSSLGSVSESELPFDGMAHLDILTKKEIKLDIDRYPPLDQDTQDAISRKFRALYERIKAEGLFGCNYWNYAIEATRYTLLFTLMLVFLRLRWYAVSAFFLGCLWHQLVFTVHDAAHISITHDFQTDSIIAVLIADFIGGLSSGWWKQNHNVHHIVTNSPEHDPDIEHMPFFAVSHRLLGSLTST